MRIFLISLPEPPQRRQSAIGKLKSKGLPFEIVDGVEAARWRSAELPLAEHSWPHLTAGQVGCYLAHLRALRRLVDYDLKWACVLEDDFCFEPDPELGLDELEERLPSDFHYIHLQRDLDFNPELRIGQRRGAFHRILGTPLATTGYVVTQPLAQYILRHHSHVEMPIDHLYSKLSHAGRFYATTIPLIGIQPGLPSVIQEVATNEAAPDR